MQAAPSSEGSSLGLEQFSKGGASGVRSRRCVRWELAVAQAQKEAKARRGNHTVLGPGVRAGGLVRAGGRIKEVDRGRLVNGAGIGT